MGGGLSHLTILAQNNPKFLEQYRNEIADVFGKEFELYKREGLSVREAQEKIYEKIQKEDLLLMLKIIRMSTGEVSEPQESNEQQIEQVLQHNLLVGANINRAKRALKFVCCIDGSEGSDLAFKTTMRLWKRHDHVILFHAFRESRQYELPPSYQAQNVKQRYEGQILERGIPSAQTSFKFEEKGKFNTFTVLRNYLLMFRYTWESSSLSNNPMRLQAEKSDSTSQYMSLIPPDFILIGYNGRTIKERQSREQEDLFLTMGSTTNVTFRNLQIPCIICKRQIPYAVSTANSEHRTFSRPLTYIMAFDHSQNSKNGLEILLQLVRACDSLKLVHFVQNQNEYSINEGGETRDEDDPAVSLQTESSELETKHALLQRKYERFLLNRGPKQTEVLLIPVPQSDELHLSLSNFICEYINKENPDFFAIAPRSQQNMTSLTEYMIANINTSIVLCKN